MFKIHNILLFTLFLIISTNLKAEVLKIEDITLDKETKYLLNSLESGSQEKTIKSIIKLIKKEKKLTKKTILYYDLGFLFLEKQNFKSSKEAFKKGLKSSNFLKSYGNYGLSKSLYELNQIKEAYSLIKDFPQTQDRLSQDIFWLKIDCLIQLQDYSLASTKLTSYLGYTKLKLRQTKSSLKIKYRKQKEKILYYLGYLEKKSNIERSEMNYWKQVIEEYPENSYEKDILAQINKEEKVTLFKNLDWEKRAKNLIQIGHPLKANHIYKFLEKKNSKINYDEDIAFTLFKAKDYEKAAHLYAKLVSNSPKGKSHLELLSKLGSSYARSDQFHKAIKIQKKILKLYPTSKEGRKAHARIRFLTFDSGDYKKSKQLYTKALKAAPTRYKRIKIHWYRFWSKYLLKEYSSSLIDLNQILKHERRLDRQLKYIYWKGRVLEKLQKYDSAIIQYKRLIKSDIAGYYFWQAHDRLNILNKLDEVELKLPNLVDYIIDSNKNNNLYKRKFKLDHPWIKSLALSEIGQIQYVDSISKHSKNFYSVLSPSELFSAYHLTHHYTSLSLWGRKQILKSKQAPPIYYWYASYPLAYEYWVNQASTKLDLDKNLIWSIMRQESIFNATILSPANAMGLMQIIAPTGYEIAEELKFEDFHPDLLLKPRINIYFGAWYINKRLKEFNHHLPYAIASYNAGPDAVNRWKKWGDQLEQDEFIDLIPYTETRNYVKKVLSNYRTYNYIYDQKK